MLSTSVLFLMEQGCGGAWRSGRSPAWLRINGIDSGTYEVDENDRFLYIYIYIYVYIYIFIYIYIYICLFTYYFF